MSFSFLHGVEGLFGWTLTASWQAAVLVVIVLYVQKLAAPRLNARWRHALWLLVLMRLVLPALPESELSLFQFAPRTPPALVVAVERPFLDPDAGPPRLPGLRPEGPAPAQPVSIYSILAIAWLAGAGGLLAMTWLVNHRFARQVARANAVSDPDLLRLFDEAKAEFGIRRAIRLVECERVQSPAIMGFFQPALLLPAGARERFDEGELRLIFLHEMAHLKRGDLFIQGLIAVLQIVHWFNPVLWFAFHRMRVDREPATDALVLSRAGEADKQRYGLMLVKLLEHFEERHSLPTLIGLLEEKDEFKQRITLIARFVRGGYGWSIGAALLIAALAAVCLTRSKTQAVAPPSPAPVVAAAPVKSSAPEFGPEDTPLPTDNAQTADLYRACDRGDLDAVKRLVAAGAPIDGHIGKIRCTALMQAVYRKQPDIVRFLLDSHANPNVVDAEGSTALLHACLGGDTEIVKMLIASGVDVSLGSHFGRTPLMYAAKKGNDDAVQALLEAHAKIDANCDQGPAVMWAVAGNHASTVRLLADAGANVNLGPENASPSSYSALGMAAASGELEVIDSLIDKNADLNGSGGPDGMTPVFAALQYDKTDALRALLNAGADVNRRDKDGQTPLMNACVYANPESVRVLLNHRADVNATDPHGETALTLAGDIGETESVDMLRQAGAKRTDVHIIVKGPPDPNLTPAQQWALAVAMIYTQRGGFTAGVLGGAASVDSRRDMLRRDWSVSDKASLLKQLDDLRASGMHADYRKKGAQLAALTNDQFNQFLDDHSNQSAEIRALRASYAGWKNRTGLAWDLCRAANLVNAGYAAHYLTEQEAWDQLMKIAKQTQAAFGSWQEMSDNFLDGREIWNNGRDPHFEACAQLLLNPKDANSPWNKMAWSTDLAGN